MNETIIARLREGTGLPVLRKLMFEAADVIENQKELIRTLTLSCCYIDYGAGVWLDMVCWKPILPPDIGEGGA